MGGVYSLVRYRATERNEATEDYWLHTLLSHLLLDQEEDEGEMNELDLCHIVLEMKTLIPNLFKNFEVRFYMTEHE